MADSQIILKLAGTDDEQRLVFGIASMATDANGNDVVDLQGDIIPPAELEAAFYDLVENGRLEGDVNHDGEPVCRLAECAVITPSKLQMMLKSAGYAGDVSDFNGTFAWVGYRVYRDSVWKAVKAGELRAFSIAGKAQKVPA